MDVTLNETGNIEFAFTNFGRNKLMSVNYYTTQFSGNVYVHLKNKQSGKSISLGFDEYEELVALSADVNKMAKRLTKENKTSVEDVAEPPMPDVSKTGSKRKHNGMKGKGSAMKGKNRSLTRKPVELISDDDEEEEEEDGEESDDECSGVSRGKHRK